MALADVLKALGAGAQQGHNRETLGPDFAERLARLVEQLKTSRQAREIAGAEEGRAAEIGERNTREAGLQSEAELLEAQGAELPLEPGDTPENVTAVSPDRLVAKLRAKKAAEDRGLGQMKVGSEVEENLANAEYLRARPDMMEQQLQQKQAAIDAAEKRGADQREIANMRLDLARNMYELAKDREVRLEEQYRNRPHVPMGVQERLEGIGSLRFSLRHLEGLMKEPEVQQLLGPISGRAASGLAGYFGGAGLTEKQKDFILFAEDALSQEAFTKGGQQLTGGELIRFRKTSILPSDTVEMANRKLLQRKTIFEESLRRRFAAMSPIQRDQMREYMRIQGIDVDDLVGSTPTTPDSAQPTVPGTAGGKAREVVPGGSNAPAPTGEPSGADKPRMVWNKQLGKFVPAGSQ